MSGIVVGIDGSHNASHAPEWAMTEAALRNAPLTVVTAVATVSAKLGTQQPASVTIIAAHGFHVESLLDAAEDCDLLVVGSRGGGAAPSCDAGTD